MMKKIKLILVLMIGITAFGQQNILNELPVNTNVKEIIVICKTHFDLGYTHRVKDLMLYYRTTMIDKALDVMDQTNTLPEEQRFTWTAPGWVVAMVIEDWAGQTPERRQRIDEAMKSGRIVAHAVPFTLESESIFPECMTRGFEFSNLVCEKNNLPLPRSHQTRPARPFLRSQPVFPAYVRAGIKFRDSGFSSSSYWDPKVLSCLNQSGVISFQ